ncbi:retrovirus-related pol polyprotein from transposon TNT 1-94 [Tanacetum coccineum]
MHHYAIDVEPIPPKSRNNREVHLEYLKHLKESIGSLREIIEEARVEKTLDNSLVSAYLYTKHSQELHEYVIGTCSKDFNKRDRKIATTHLNKKKLVTFMEPGVKDATAASGSKRRKIGPCQLRAPMFLWAEVVATACYTQNRSLIHTHHNKTSYELVHDKKHDLNFLRVFGALCYPTNDSEDLRKLRPTADMGIFVGYAPNRKGYRIYNKRTRKIMEMIHVQFDELSKLMAPVHISTGPEPILLTPRQIV